LLKQAVATILRLWFLILNKYDLLCAIYEDATNEEKIKLSEEIAELEIEIHKIERNY